MKFCYSVWPKLSPSKISPFPPQTPCIYVPVFHDKGQTWQLALHFLVLPSGPYSLYSPVGSLQCQNTKVTNGGGPCCLPPWGLKKGAAVRSETPRDPEESVWGIRTEFDIAVGQFCYVWETESSWGWCEFYGYIMQPEDSLHFLVYQTKLLHRVR